MKRPITLTAVASLALFLVACQSGSHAVRPHSLPPANMPGMEAAEAKPYFPPRVIRLSNMPDLDGIIPKLAEKRVVFVGEGHTSYDHHLNQLEIIRGLYELDPNLAIGMEFFQLPFQGPLDLFIAGELSDTEMLRQTEYYDRWRYDYRLYREIFEFARENRIRIIALNTPKEIASKVGLTGLVSLTEEERAQIPTDIDHSNKEYEKRLKKIFKMHKTKRLPKEEFFIQAQLVWDETMADRAARYLKDNPKHKLVVLAGAGHVAYGDGIPSRVTRRLPVSSAIVMNALYGEIDPKMGDYLLLPQKIKLPPSGKLGVILEPHEGGVKIGSFVKGSAAAEVGIEEGDNIVGVNGMQVGRYSDVKLALWDKMPGDKVSLKVKRKGLFSGEEELKFDVILR